MTSRHKRLVFHCRLSPSVTTFASVDASFADLPEYFSSYGWAVHICGAAWSWRVSKTSLQTHSACESEYNAIDDLAREVEQLIFSQNFCLSQYL